MNLGEREHDLDAAHLAVTLFRSDSVQIVDDIVARNLPTLGRLLLELLHALPVKTVQDGGWVEATEHWRHRLDVPAR